VDRTTRNKLVEVGPIVDGPFILKAQKLARRIVVAPHVQDYAIRLILATHPGGSHIDQKLAHYIHVGVSPRGAQALISAAKVKALMDGRYAVGFRDLQAVAPAALRHRIMRSFEAEADGVTVDRLIEQLMEYVPREAEPSAA